MGLKNFELLTKATAVHTATADAFLVAYADDGMSVQNGLHVVDTSSSDYATMKSITFKLRRPVVNVKTGAYGKDKRTIVHVVPVRLASGAIVFNTLRIEREIHPETNASDIAAIDSIGCQLLSIAATEDFRGIGSLA